MAKIGYKRVSSADQGFDRQDLGGCDKIFEEKVSGGRRTDRQALADMIAWSREDDEVLVWSIDRLARDLRDLEAIVGELNAKGVGVSFLSEGLTFSASKDDAMSRLQLQMMGAFGQFERAIIRKRQAEGIAKAKMKGAYKGRKRTIDAAKVLELQMQGLGPSAIARELGIGRASVYRLIK